MIGQQDLLAAKLRMRLRVEVIRVPVRKPHETTSFDVVDLLLRNIVRVGPAAKIRVVRYPRIGAQDRSAVETDDGRVTNRFEPQLHARKTTRKITDTTVYRQQRLESTFFAVVRATCYSGLSSVQNARRPYRRRKQTPRMRGCERQFGF